MTVWTPEPSSETPAACVIRTLGSGDSFGELSYLHTLPVSANVTAGGDGCECFVLPPEEGALLKLNFPLLAEYIAKTVLRRSYVRREQPRDTNHSPPLPTPPILSRSSPTQSTSPQSPPTTLHNNPNPPPATVTSTR